MKVSQSRLGSEEDRDEPNIVVQKLIYKLIYPADAA